MVFFKKLTTAVTGKKPVPAAATSSATATTPIDEPTSSLGTSSMAPSNSTATGVYTGPVSAESSGRPSNASHSRTVSHGVGASSMVINTDYVEVDTEARAASVGQVHLGMPRKEGAGAQSSKRTGMKKVEYNPEIASMVLDIASPAGSTASAAASLSNATGVMTPKSGVSMDNPDATTPKWETTPKSKKSNAGSDPSYTWPPTATTPNSSNPAASLTTSPTGPLQTRSPTELLRPSEFVDKTSTGPRPITLAFPEQKTQTLGHESLSSKELSTAPKEAAADAAKMRVSAPHINSRTIQHDFSFSSGMWGNSRDSQPGNKVILDLEAMRKSSKNPNTKSSVFAPSGIPNLNQDGEDNNAIFAYDPPDESQFEDLMTSMDLGALLKRHASKEATEETPAESQSTLPNASHAALGNIENAGGISDSGLLQAKNEHSEESFPPRITSNSISKSSSNPVSKSSSGKQTLFSSFDKRGMSSQSVPNIIAGGVDADVTHEPDSTWSLPGDIGSGKSLGNSNDYYKPDSVELHIVQDKAMQQTTNQTSLRRSSVRFLDSFPSADSDAQEQHQPRQEEDHHDEHGDGACEDEHALEAKDSLDISDSEVVVESLNPRLSAGAYMTSAEFLRRFSNPASLLSPSKSPKVSQTAAATDSVIATDTNTVEFREEQLIPAHDGLSNESMAPSSGEQERIVVEPQPNEEAPLEEGHNPADSTNVEQPGVSEPVDTEGTNIIEPETQESREISIIEPQGNADATTSALIPPNESAAESTVISPADTDTRSIVESQAEVKTDIVDSAGTYKVVLATDAEEAATGFVGVVSDPPPVLPTQGGDEIFSNTQETNTVVPSSSSNALCAVDSISPSEPGETVPNASLESSLLANSGPSGTGISGESVLADGTLCVQDPPSRTGFSGVQQLSSTDCASSATHAALTPSTEDTAREIEKLENDISRLHRLSQSDDLPEEMVDDIQQLLRSKLARLEQITLRHTEPDEVRKAKLDSQKYKRLLLNPDVTDELREIIHVRLAKCETVIQTYFAQLAAHTGPSSTGSSEAKPYSSVWASIRKNQGAVTNENLSKSDNSSLMADGMKGKEISISTSLSADELERQAVAGTMRKGGQSWMLGKNTEQEASALVARVVKSGSSATLKHGQISPGKESEYDFKYQELAKKLKEAETELRDLRDSFETDMAYVKDLKMEADRNKAEIARQKTTMEARRAEIATLNRQLKEKASRHFSISLSRKSTEAWVEQQQSHLVQLEKDISSCDSFITVNERELRLLEDRIDEIMLKHSENATRKLEDKCRRLRRELADLQSFGTDV